MKFGHEIALVGLLALLICGAGIFDPQFLNWRVQSELSNSVWQLVVIAIPMTFVILTGGIDLSVGAAMSLSAVAMGLAKEAGMGLWTSVLIALITGVLCGLINGVLVSKLNSHPLIVTLATMAAYFGLAEGLSHARPISDFPPEMGTVFSVQTQCILAIVFVILGLVYLERTVLGQTHSSIGFNERATRFSGLPVDKTKLLAYTLCGLGSGFAAVFFVALRNTAKADIGQGMELQIVTAVVLGGTSVAGGRGGLWGTILGVLLVHETRNFVSWHWERDELNQIVIGVLLISTVLIKKLIDWRRSDAK